MAKAISVLSSSEGVARQYACVVFHIKLLLKWNKNSFSLMKIYRLTRKSSDDTVESSLKQVNKLTWDIRLYSDNIFIET